MNPNHVCINEHKSPIFQALSYRGKNDVLGFINCNRRDRLDHYYTGRILSVPARTADHSPAWGASQLIQSRLLQLVSWWQLWGCWCPCRCVAGICNTAAVVRNYDGWYFGDVSIVEPVAGLTAIRCITIGSVSAFSLVRAVRAASLAGASRCAVCRQLDIEIKLRYDHAPWIRIINHIKTGVAVFVGFNDDIQFEPAS